MGEWEDLLAQVRDEGLDEVADTLDEKYSKTGLRRQLAEKSKDAEEATKLREEVALLKAGPVRREALAGAGVDYDSLRPAEREIVDSSSAETYDDGWARGLVEKYQLPVTGSAEESTEGIPAAQFGRPEGPAGQTAKGGAASGVLTPAAYAAWPVDKRMRFMEWATQNRPDAIAALDDGLPVSGVTFS
jgi:hypothetical protein